ncbi:MAG: hypothetical protein QNJ90_09590 [Planctomycetota bacterium]|nr:hypothetical protein [Planctomycetota bacterium]
MGVYLLALVLTVLVETLLAMLIRPRQRRRLLVDVPLMNLVTHPLLALGRSAGLELLTGELLVMFVEGAVYRGVTRLNLAWSIILAFGLNLLTWIGGEFLFARLGLS